VDAVDAVAVAEDAASSVNCPFSSMRPTLALNVLVESLVASTGV
jgi:hypothetical protein